MNKALDEQCAALLGWHKGVGGAIGGIAGVESSVHWYDADGKRCRECVTDVFANLRAFSPTSNDADTKLLEDAIERAGLGYTYGDALWEIESGDFTYTISGSEVWRVIRATLEQRTRAFIAAHTEKPQ